MTTQTLTIEQIAAILDARRINPRAFWGAATGGDMAPLPARVVGRVCNEMVGSGARAYAWLDPHDGLWRVGDRDNAGTHRPGVSEACARHEAAAANERDQHPASRSYYWGGRVVNLPH